MTNEDQQYPCRPIKAETADDLPVTDRANRISYLDGDESADNYKRAGFAAEALKAYARRVGTLTGEEVDVPIRDFLGDLMHLVDGLIAGGSIDTDRYPDFDALLESARGAYEAELRGTL